MSVYRGVAKFRIHPGKADEFRRIAAQSVALARAHDPGTQQYDWFINEAGTECLVLETYASSDALIAHARNVGKLVGQLMQMSDCTVDMSVDPPEPLPEQLKRMSITVFHQVDGLQHGHQPR
jgi:quinol monooxygenase YgiN